MRVVIILWDYRTYFPLKKPSLMVSRLHCGAQLALIQAQITQLVPGLPPFEGKRNFVTESSVCVFLFQQPRFYPGKGAET